MDTHLETTARRRPSPPTVLLATTSPEPPPWALHRAWALAQALQGHLEILRVVTRTPRVGPLFPHFASAAALGDLEAFVESQHRLEEWVEEVLPGRLEPSALHVEEGRFIEEVIQAAVDLEAALVVLPSAEARHPKAVTGIARLTGAPVLVVRPLLGSGVVAATDLAYEGLPVVRKAADLVDRLRTSLVVVHNVPRLELEPGDDVLMASAAVAASDEGLVELYRRKLEASLTALSLEARPVVLHQVDAVDAILRTARRFEADLLVVGAPVASRLFHAATAERVIKATVRSVLVMPLS